MSNPVTTTRSINVAAVLILLVGSVLLGVGTHFLHAYQVKRNAHTLLDQADVAERDGEPDQVADYLGQYLQMAPNDTSVLARYGLLRHVWHPALFVFSIYIIVLSSMVLVIAR